ncbi:MAG TPA: hypothetical protein VGO61_03100 [Steroidobacteraceae bacterium]|jgi:hypothetical protein|nr:hypothetical protein [Steroidobacteraceae bacterium]
MNEKPLERLNYFNGQRLQAADLKLEQDYHIRVRRWLNRSLYSAGIAEGLSVYAIKDHPQVRVTAGLAIDHLGREIILLEDQVVDVVGTHHDSNGKCDGPYLTIRYQEDVVGKEDSSCALGGNSANRAAWGAPGRILAGAVLELNAELPNEASGRIPLACLTLAEKCASVQIVDTGVRRYIGESSANKVKQYALEGVRDIDSNNAGQVRFHIRGRQPAGITLYLRAERFPTLFYTEMGKHNHGSSAESARPETSAPVLHPDTGNPDKYKHSHGLNTLVTTGEGSAHDHSVFEVTFEGAHSDASDKRLSLPIVQVGDPVYADIMPVLSTANRWGSPPGTPFTARISGATSHTHGFGGELEKVSVSDDHTHLAPLLSISDAGVSDISARDDSPEVPQAALTFVDDLQLYIGSSIRNLTSITENVLNQLRAAQPDVTWNKLGNGLGDHVFAARGSGEIKLHFLPGMAFSEGEYLIELRAPSRGGRVHFNLYVE